MYEENDFRVEEIKGSKKDIYKKIIDNDLYLKQNYSNLINKSMGFEPIDNIDDFIYSFLMEEDKIDLNDLKAKARAYQELKIKVEICNKKILALKDIVSNYEIYKENEEKIKDLNVVQALQNYNKNLEELKQKNDELESKNFKLKSLNFEKLDLSDKIKNFAENILLP